MIDLIPAQRPRSGLDWNCPIRSLCAFFCCLAKLWRKVGSLVAPPFRRSCFPSTYCLLNDGSFFLKGRLLARLLLRSSPWIPWRCPLDRLDPVAIRFNSAPHLSKTEPLWSFSSFSWVSVAEEPTQADFHHFWAAKRPQAYFKNEAGWETLLLLV